MDSLSSATASGVGKGMRMKALLNVKELASALGVSVKSIHRAYRRKEIPVVRTEGRILYPSMTGL